MRPTGTHVRRVVAELALTTTGPGAANTLGAVGEAWAGRSPIVVVATDIPSTLRRQGVYRGALHEMVDQGAMFAPLVKKVMKVERAVDAGEVLSAAISEALSPPSRPVYVEVPTDFLSDDVQRDANGGPIKVEPPRIVATEDADRDLSRCCGRPDPRSRSARSSGPGAALSRPQVVRLSHSWRSAWRRPCSPPIRPAGFSDWSIRVPSVCRRTCPPPDACGTRPTW